MKITKDNLERFITSLRTRLQRELEEGASVAIRTREHYPETRIVRVGGHVYPYPAVGETMSIQIGICPEPKFEL